MKKLTILTVVASAFVSATAFAEPPAPAKAPTPAPAAAPKAPAGQGDFRRAEVVKAAGVKPENATVMGLSTASQNANQGAKIPKDIRIEAVEAYKGPNAGKVTLVKAPVDKSEPVSKVTTREAHEMGLVTQKDAQAAASKNGGVVGSDKKVEVKADGLGGNGYGFKQTAPSSIRIKEYGEKYDASNIRRTVTFTGSGESASFASKEVPAPKAPEAPKTDSK